MGTWSTWKCWHGFEVGLIKMLVFQFPHLGHQCPHVPNMSLKFLKNILIFGLMCAGVSVRRKRRATRFESPRKRRDAYIKIPIWAAWNHYQQRVCQPGSCMYSYIRTHCMNCSSIGTYVYLLVHIGVFLNFLLPFNLQNFFVSSQRNSFLLVWMLLILVIDGIFLIFSEMIRNI